MKYPWLFEGATVICVNSLGWLRVKRMGPIAIIGGERPGPAFMTECVVTGIEEPDNTPEDGREYALQIAGYEEHGYYCICNFRPLEKLEDEVEQKAKEPIDA